MRAVCDDWITPALREAIVRQKSWHAGAGIAISTSQCFCNVGALERPASKRTHEGGSRPLNLCIVLFETNSDFGADAPAGRI
jgi:hypothetical protein